VHHQEREAQHILDERRRMEQEEHAQQMQSDMRHIQAIEQEEHQQRVVQLEAQHLQNDIRLANRAAATEREENEVLSQMAEQFRREQEEIVKMLSDMIKYTLLKMLPEWSKRLQKLQQKHRQKLLHRQKLRLLCKQKYKQP
jgi:hypothetical protein